jgi:GNAT superfamily N-acetyltransferase
VNELPVVIRLARPDEYSGLAQLYSRLGYRGGIAAEDAVLVAEVGPRVVGLVRRTKEAGLTILRGMQVDPAYQRRRVGTRLLDALVAGLAGDVCYCTPFDHLTDFYGRVGFEVVEEPDAPAYLIERARRYRALGERVLIMRRDGEQEASIDTPPRGTKRGERSAG